MKKILTIFALSLFCAPFIAFAADECTNSNILAHFINEPADTLYFITNGDIQITSLEAAVNGKYKPVQYTAYGGFIIAKVLLDRSVNEYRIGAARIGQCNSNIKVQL